MACASGTCVVVNIDGGNVHVTDSKMGAASPVLTYTLAEWQREVVDEICDGGWLPNYTYRDENDAVTMRQQLGGTELRFTAEEWDVFVDDVRAGKYSEPTG